MAYRVGVIRRSNGKPLGPSDFVGFGQVMELLLSALQVGSRHLQLTCKALPREYDQAYAQINASWLDSRPTSEAAPEPPAATAAQVRVEIKKH